MGDCIFCKIIKGELPSEKVYEDDMIMCFKDLEPQAPVHLQLKMSLLLVDFWQILHELFCGVLDEQHS